LGNSQLSEKQVSGVKGHGNIFPKPRGEGKHLEEKKKPTPNGKKKPKP